MNNNDWVIKYLEKLLEKKEAYISKNQSEVVSWS